MISRKELFAEISNDAVCEDGEVVGYFVKNSRMDLLEQMLCSQVTVKLPEYRNSPDMHTKQYYEVIGFNLGLDACVESLAAAGIQVIEGEGQ